MPAPQMVQHSRFPMAQYVFDGDGFAIAWGTWDEASPCLGMRWNGDDEGDPGYPKVFGRPVWLVIPENLTRPILAGLLVANLPGTNLEAIVEVLRELH